MAWSAGLKREAPGWWAAIVTTDRPGSLSLLCDDLARQAEAAQLPLGILLVENSAQEANLLANERTVARLRSRGITVRVDASDRPGDGIAPCRLRLREMARALRNEPRPGFLWALDDDVRLLHLIWAEDHLEVRALHDHVRFLLAFGAENPNVDLLIGEVSGDPPVPATAMLATTLSDVAANLTLLFAREPASCWEPDPHALEVLNGLDAYYDLSLDRPRPAWESVVTWLPRRPGLTVAGACAELLAEVSHVPLGAAVTRPILAQELRFGCLGGSLRRGANAIFFDVEAFLEHEYPSAIVTGIETRRSDMIGAQCLARRRPGRVRSSGFSVLHRRPRGCAWPAPGELARGLLADTLGAALARAVEARLGGVGDPRSFLDARIARIEQATSAIAATIARLESLLSQAPGWVPVHSLDALRAVLDWGRTCVPGAVAGLLSQEFGDPLRCPSVARELQDRATLIVQECAQ